MSLSYVTMLVLFGVLADANVTPKSGIQNRLQGLEKKEKEQVMKLEIYEASGQDVKDLGRWFCMTAGLDNPSSDEALRKLKVESCDEELHSAVELTTGLIDMCDAFEEANMSVNGCPPKLHRVECIAIYMYTSQFYSTYNPNVRKGHWKPYKVFTAILYSALSQLDKIHPLPSNTILYRGMDKKFDIDSKGRFYFKQFVSTTLDEEVAESFGTGTVIVIVPDVPIIAAQLKDLSKYPGEEEVLISPFEAFEFVNKTGNKLFFKSSRSQDFIDKEDLQCQDEHPVKKLISKSFNFTVLVGHSNGPPVAVNVHLLGFFLLAFTAFWF